MAIQYNETKIEDKKLGHKFVLYRVSGVIVLVLVAMYLLFVSSRMTNDDYTNFLYIPESPVDGLIIEDSDKSAFETLTVKDIQNQFANVRNNLQVNQAGYKILTGNIGVRDPFKYGNVKGNEFVRDNTAETTTNTGTTAPVETN